MLLPCKTLRYQHMTVLESTAPPVIKILLGIHFSDPLITEQDDVP